MSPVVASLALLLGAAAADEPVRLAELDFEGHVVFASAYYRAALADAGFGDQPFQLKAAARQLQRLLRRNGYTIAQVRVALRDGRPVLVIDEGRLARIVFIGANTVRTLQLQLTVSLPQDVFNKEVLLPQLANIQRDLGLRCQYEIVRTGREHEGLQLDELFDAGTPARFELRIRFSQPAFREGWLLHSTYNMADGLRLGTSYGATGLFFDRDAWRVRADVGGKRFLDVERDSGWYGLSRAIVDLRWYTPPFGDRDLRTFAWVYGDYLVRQRIREQLEAYRWFRGGALANVAYAWNDNLEVAIGLGGEERSLIDVDQPADAARRFARFDEWRLITALQNDLLFDPKTVRRDRHHQLHLELRYLRSANGDNQGWGELSYQKVFELGWHELWLRAHGVGLVGAFPIMDEEPVNRHVRGVFPEDFTPRILAASVEFRFSLLRDLAMLSAYADAAGFAPTPFGDRAPPVRGAFAGGLGVHALVLDFIQVDVYYGAGIMTDGRFDHGLAGRLIKAY